MAHVCTSCGCDCSHLRRPPDPVYGLPLVVCPGCGRARVDRLIAARWRSTGIGATIAALWQLLLRSATVLMLSGIGIALMALTSGAIDIALHPSQSERLIEQMSPWEGVGFTLLLLALTLLLTSLGLRWALGHLRHRARILTWVGTIAILTWGLPNLFMLVDSVLVVGPRYGPGLRSTSHEPSPVRLELGHWLWPVTLLLMACTLAMLGPLADRFGRYTGQQAWLARLARHKRRRARRRS